jgi:DNA-binding winged helix-turn-helix (wHTH) protein
LADPCTAPATIPAASVLGSSNWIVGRANSGNVGSGSKLQEQPFQVLAKLLEKPRELVTREELRQRLWTSDTFVDFDHGLNKAINKIRGALGDSAASPRFIETVAPRGYRFIADVASVKTNLWRRHLW